jgi:lysozyme family protein
MTAADYNACEARVLAHEGGYTNDARDPGGPTNWGITLEDARLYWKRNATAADVRAMPVSVAKDIYRSKYWNALRCDDLPAGVDDTVFDYGVNSGVGRAGKVLRRVMGLPDDDWHVTSVVMIPLSRRDPAAVIKAINDERLKFLQHLSTWRTFGGGWAKRVAEVRAYSLALSAGVPPHGAPPVVVAVPTGKGQVPKPNTAPVTKAGTAAVVASGGLFHWLGAHPALTIGLLAAGAALILFIVSRIRASHQAQQEAPTPGTVPVPPAA